MKNQTKKSSELTLAEGVEIASITFKAAGFANEAAVSAYLTDNGFSDFDIAVEAGDFVVKGIDAESFESVSTIELSDGNVSVVAGQLKAPITPPTPTATTKAAEKWLTAKGESVVQKFSYWLAHESDGTTVTAVLRDALSDGVPIGFDEASQAYQVALSNLIEAGDLGSIGTLTSEYGTYISKLANFLETSVASKDAKVLAKVEALSRKIAAITEEEPAPTPEPAPEPTPALPEPTEELASKSALAVAVSSITALELRLKALEDAQSALATKAELGEVSTTITKAESRLAQVEQLRQTRKSDPDAQIRKENNQADPAKMSKAQMNLLGIRS